MPLRLVADDADNDGYLTRKSPGLMTDIQRVIYALALSAVRALLNANCQGSLGLV